MPEPGAGPGKPLLPGSSPGPPGGEGVGRSPDVPLRWNLSRHARRLVTLALAGLGIAVVTGRPEFAGVAAPALLLLATWHRARPARVRLAARLAAARMIEGERSAVTLTVSGTAHHVAQVVLHPAHGIVPLPGPASPTASPGPSAGRAAEQTVSVPFLVTRWGRRRVGTAQVILRDRWRLAEGIAQTGLPGVACYPRPAMQRTRVVLSRLPQRLGEHTARAAGEGAEFGGVREYVPGDRQRSINWPATTRRGRLQVNTFQAERAQDVIILVDTAWESATAGHSVVDIGLRGAAAAARAYLDARDRVGFITYRYRARWLVPGLGQRQYYRIAEAMLAQDRDWTADTGFARLPRAALPPGALILVFTPLMDPRLVETLRDLRQRGFPVLVIDVLNGEPPAGRGRAARLAQRLWRMEQQAIRFSLRELGIPVTHWDGEQSLDLSLAPYTRRVMVTRR
jgi:uncharacterized protein (DUF58 family)